MNPLAPVKSILFFTILKLMIKVLLETHTKKQKMLKKIANQVSLRKIKRIGKKLKTSKKKMKTKN